MEYIESLIRDVPDFPKPGIVFKDISPLLGDGKGFSRSIDIMAERAQSHSVTALVGIESRGFIFGAALAQKIGVGFVPVRKPGKLPAKTLRQSYELEYGTDSVEIHHDALRREDRVLVIDDLVATGGTLAATCDLVEQLGAEVCGCLVLIELEFLDGRGKLGGRPLDALLKY